MFCDNLPCCQHWVILSMRWREFWTWHRGALVKSCCAIDSRGDLMKRGGREMSTISEDRHLLRMARVHHFISALHLRMQVIRRSGRHMTTQTVINRLLAAGHRFQRPARCPRLTWCIGDVVVSGTITVGGATWSSWMERWTGIATPRIWGITCYHGRKGSSDRTLFLCKTRSPHMWHGLAVAMLLSLPLYRSRPEIFHYRFMSSLAWWLPR